MDMNREFKTVYGGKEIALKIPEENLECVIQSHVELAKPLANPEQVLMKCLEKPIGCDKLVDMVKPSDKVTLISSEYMRMPYTWILAPIVVDLLKKKCGVKDENITLVNAPGTHQNEDEQLANPIIGKLFGSLYGKHKIVMHDCDKKEDLRYMGMTSQGTPVFVNKVVADADVKIGFGELSPHHSAGHCGGGKIINPGCVGRPTLGAMHRRVLMQRVPGGNHKEWQTGYWGNGRENEVRRDIEDTAAIAGLDFKIDAVTIGPERANRELVGIYAGDFVKEYREGIEQCKKLYGTKAKKADISVYLSGEAGGLMTSIALGPPPRVDQATKADGIQIYVASSELGYARTVKRPESAMIHGKHIAYNPYWMRMSASDLAWRLTGDLEGPINLRDVSLMWQTKVTLETRKCYLVTQYTNKQLMLDWGFSKVFRTLDDALADAYKEKGKDARVTVVIGGNGYYMPE